MRRRISPTIISAIIVIAMSTCSVCAFSEDTPGESMGGEKYQYIESISTTLSISSGSANAGVRIRDTDGDTKKISCTMYLQKKSNGSWSSISSWSKSTTSNTLTMSQTKAVVKGEYRVKSVIKAYKGSAYETITNYSKVKSY